MGDTVTPDVGKIKKYLGILWPTAKKGLLTVNWPDERGNFPSKFFPISNIDSAASAVASLAGRYDTYTCCGLYGSKPKGRGEEIDVIAIPGFKYEVDCEGGIHKKKGKMPTIEEVLSFLNNLELKSSLIVFSGGGIHAYWLFNEALYFSNGDGQAVKALAEKFHNYIASLQKKNGWNVVDNICALNWVLRPAGTINHKGDPLPVEFLEENDIRYELSDIEEFLELHGTDDADGHEETTNQKEAAGIDIDGLEIPFLVRKAIKNGLPEGQRSEAIASVLTALIRAGLNDKNIIFIFENHPHGIGAKYFEKKNGRQKWLKAEIKRSRKFVASADLSFQSDDDVEVQEWPEPMASEAFDGFVGKFVKIATKNSEADPHAVLMTFLSRFGVEVGNSHFLFVGDAKHYARLNVVIVGNSSKARKGTSGKPVNRVFEYRDIWTMLDGSGPVLNPSRVTPGPLSSGEGIIYAVRDPVHELQRNKKTGETEDVLVDSGVDDKRLFIFDEEFASVLAAAKREGSTLSTIIRCLWDTGDLEPLTKNRRIKSTGAHVGVTTHITGHELFRRIDETELFNGFGNRFLWPCARRNRLVAFPEPIPEKLLSSFQHGLIKILREISNIGEMKFSDPAKELWKSIYPELSKDHSGLVGAIINRGEAQVMRLSMVYALLDSYPTIQVEHLKSALAVWKYCEDSARFIFGGRQENKHSQKILEMLQEKGQCKSKDIYDLFSNNITKKQIETAMSELLSQGKVKIEKLKKGQGRPTVLFKIVRKL